MHYLFSFGTEEVAFLAFARAAPLAEVGVIEGLPPFQEDVDFAIAVTIQTRGYWYD